MAKARVPSTKNRFSATRALVELEQEKAESRAQRPSLIKMFRTYLVPLLVIAVFGGILFVLIIPGTGIIFSQLDEAGQLNEQTEAANEQLLRLQALSARSAEIDADIKALSNIIPQGVTEVVNFQQEVRRLAEAKNALKLTLASSAEQPLRTIIPGVTDTETLIVLEIPSTFTAVGTLNDIKTFINDIEALKDFVIIGEMQLRIEQQFTAEQLASVENGEWRLSINLIKYQFQTVGTEAEVNELYLSVPETTQISAKVLEYIRAKNPTPVENLGDIELSEEE